MNTRLTNESRFPLVKINMPFKDHIRDSLIRLNGFNFKIKKYSIEDTIILAGSPRSGTTWLSEILRTIPGYTLIFEPLHPLWFPECAHIGFQHRTYLKPDATWIDGENYLKKALTGKVVSNRYRGFNDVLCNLLSTKLIVKFVRANRLLPWMTRNFQVRKTILLIRHPCAVIASQIKSGYSGYNQVSTGRDFWPKKDNLIKEIEQIEGIDPNIVKTAEQINTIEELLAVTWCLDNYVPLYSPYKNSWVIVPYETLIINGAEALKQIFDLSGISPSKKYLKQLSVPSRKASDDLIAGDNHQLLKWRSYLTRDQSKNILKIAEKFGLDFYNENQEPDYLKLERFGLLIKN